MDSTERPSTSALSSPSVGLLTPTGGGGGSTESRRNPRRHNRGASAQDRPANPAPRPPRNRRPRDAHEYSGNPSVSQHQRATSPALPTDGRRRQKSAKTTTPSNVDHSTPATAATAVADANAEDHLRLQTARNHPKKNSRRGEFNGRLTEFEPPAIANESPNILAKPSNRYHAAGQKDDLTSTLTNALRTPPYPDCPICFSSIHPVQPTWSCSPSIPIATPTTSSGDDSDVPAGREKPSSYCWTTFHVKCIRSWAAKSVKDVSDAWRARGEDRGGEWRCPGCQAKREVVPTGYWCFCGSTLDPKPPRLATPHSCANLCSRPRTCGHPCPLSCHPGPCPPCHVTVKLRCHCGRRPLSFRCSNLTGGKEGSGSMVGADLSCGTACGKTLGCGTHFCQKPCHPDDCEPCGVTEVAKCYCGKLDKEVNCGEGEAKDCVLHAQGGEAEQRWRGRFICDNVCNRPFDCAVHFCSKQCHPPSPRPPPCPRSPSLVSHCPCGKQELSSSNTSSFPPDTLLSRTTCLDPIPTCSSTCMKPLATCSHVCSATCHTGPCPPCTIMLVRPCRCGATTKNVPCSSVAAGIQDDILCDRPCAVLRACGRHQCNRVCCPLASLASATKGKGKKRGVGGGILDQAGISEMGLHECDLVCGRVLSCGNHRCEERDHRGICPPCLRSSFEEMTCYCGRTVTEPPIPCGTQIHCTYPCSRPPPPCGHPLTQHSCHEDPLLCPSCPFLTSKKCACGKKVVENVQCSQKKVSCGTACGKLLACGFHQCERICHSDDCGPCNSPCGKSLKLCLPALHPCTLPCHAPSTCPELEPCRAITTLSCTCGRIRQRVPCGRCSSNPAGCESTQQPKCTNECHIAKRNAKLADALGINTENRSIGTVVYADEVIAFARANPKLLGLVERAFADFIVSDKRTQVLPHMPPDRRKFVLDLAAIYRMDTQTVDQEPHRSVQIFRRIDTRTPLPLLSQVVSTSPPPASLGKLADLRSPNAQPSRSPAPSPAPTPTKFPAPGTGSIAQRGWTAVVARSGTSPQTPVTGTSTVNPSPSSSSGRTNLGIGSGYRGRSQPSSLAIPLSAAMAEMTLKVPDSWEDDEEESRSAR